jgi:hypothetical protein
MVHGRRVAPIRDIGRHLNYVGSHSHRSRSIQPGTPDIHATCQSTRRCVCLQAFCLNQLRIFTRCEVSVHIPMPSRQPFSTISMSRPSSALIHSSALCLNTAGIKSSTPSTNSPDATRSSFAATDLITRSSRPISLHSHFLPGRRSLTSLRVPYSFRRGS